ncbi:heavy metal translocating P-type ATPase [Enterococcus pseudoavium]|uniref:Cd(2+)-exporting ATPase n=1 Tax=Enterococcus pseudoavium TaxID=44007 RepID=A0ABU3FGG1_9ENTE|nr:heavy metal translocating P-type ATPase [Enterococcus pseudoavium]MDT2754086.1 heavy metal translocating P-type ATPase [Enterococcus pseudoavium]MDT2770132.1 heavy metal translocating P-type ATPase [Enterococcus pseudoavium]
MKFQKKILAHKTAITFINAFFIVLALGAKFLFQQNAVYDIGMALASVFGVLPIAIQAYQAAKVKVVSIDLLVTIAVIGAFIIGEYNESAIVTFLFLLGHLLEQKTLEHTRSAIQQLVKLAPATAWKLVGNEAEEVDIDEVEVGDQLLVKTGAQVPVDGLVIEGTGYLDEANVTGESKPVFKEHKAQVFAGTILENGTLKIEAQRVGEDTTFGKIIELVEEAQDSKSLAERFIDRFAKYYTPLILVLALIVGLVTQDVRLAITILVLGCPGALIIGVPVSNVAGIGNGAKNGILIKGSEVMNTFSRVNTMVFDKTGTLTNGKPSVAFAKFYEDHPKDYLSLTAAIEGESDHPLGKAIVDYAQQQGKKKIAAINVSDTVVVKGKGMAATADGVRLTIGNKALMQEQAIAIPAEIQQDENTLQLQGNSVVFVAAEKHVVALIGIKDQIRSGAVDTLAMLKSNGIKRLIMLSGDNQTTAEIVGKELGLSEVHGGLLPEEKSAFIRRLQAEGEVVAFVGDGINDSPSIALADIGIAMGGGTDVAVETSDVVLIQSKFENLVHAYRLTKKTVLNMKENIAIAIGTVLFLLIGLIFGYVYMASGMFFHELSILIVVINGMRLLSYHTKSSKLDRNQFVEMEETVE